MPDPADAWLSTTGRQLNAHGWQLATDRYAWGDRNAARITVSYAVDLR